MLAIPLSIFIFLRIFGENKFDIPIQHTDGVKDKIGECDYGNGQFLVPDSLLGSSGLFVVFIYEARELSPNTLDNQYERIRELFKSNMPEMKVFTSDNITLDNVDIIKYPEQTLQQVMNCGFVTNIPNQYILIDAKRRIRGYYSTELDEVDRLIVEIKILIQNGDSE